MPDPEVPSGVDPFDPVLRRAALNILADPLDAAGMGEPVGEPLDGEPLNLLWHADRVGPRPVPGSPIWTHTYGCFDVVVRWNDGRLDVRTEGSTLVDEPWPDDPATFESVLRDVASRVGAVIRADIARFESENGGYLPGTEPGVGV